MSLPQHSNADIRYQQQVDNSRSHVLPFIETAMPVTPDVRVMEIGCGEGGVLIPFLEKGCHCVGVDLSDDKIALGHKYLRQYVDAGKMQLINKNIYDLDFLGEFKHSFDLIILKDAIEHIPEQDKIIGYLRNLLTPRGQVYFGFPPWYMPHGGHQQISRSKVLGALPYIHLLPVPLYKGILRAFGEPQAIIDELMEIRSTGISIERFEKIVKDQGYAITKKRFYLINPIYQYKFGLQPRQQWEPLGKLPFVRNFVTTCVYYMIH